MRRAQQWTHKHPLWFVTLFSIGYFIWFNLLEKYRKPVLMVHSSLDNVIPFNEYFVIPYLLWFVWIFGTFTYFYLKSRTDFFSACRYMFTGMVICLIIYTIVPTGLNLRATITNNNIFTELVQMIRSVDTSTNVCPSIHVFNSIAVNTVIQRSEILKDKKWVKIGSYVLAVAICLSTVMLKQHSVIDVFWGGVLGLILYPLSNTSAARDAGTEEYEVHIS